MAKQSKKSGNKGGAVAPAVNLAALMAQAVQARITGAALYSSKVEMAALITPAGGGVPLVEYNETAPGPDGRIPFRATEAGVAMYNSGAFGAPSAPAFGAPQPFGAPVQQQQPAVQQQQPAFGTQQQPGQTFGTQQPALGGTQQPAQTLAQAAPGRVYTFKKGIPIPPSRKPGRGPNTYGFEEMEVGDAFDVPQTAENPNPSKRVASTVSSATRRLAPKQFVVRAIEENGVKLARVWRSA